MKYTTQVGRIFFDITCTTKQKSTEVPWHHPKHSRLQGVRFFPVNKIQPLLEVVWADDLWHGKAFNRLMALNQQKVSMVDYLSFVIMDPMTSTPKLEIIITASWLGQIFQTVSAMFPFMFAFASLTHMLGQQKCQRKAPGPAYKIL